MNYSLKNGFIKILKANYQFYLIIRKIYSYVLKKKKTVLNLQKKLIFIYFIFYSLRKMLKIHINFKKKL